MMDRRRALMMAQEEEQGKSDMNGWSDGVAYTDLTVVNNSYCATNGELKIYSRWRRTGYVPCDGASSITFPKVGGTANNAQYNCFFSASKAFISKFNMSCSSSIQVNVPSNAAYFIISNENAVFDKCIQDGIIPNA